MRFPRQPRILPLSCKLINPSRKSETAAAVMIEPIHMCTVQFEPPLKEHKPLKEGKSILMPSTASAIGSIALRPFEA